jgi:hypothetical protein
MGGERREEEGRGRKTILLQNETQGLIINKDIHQAYDVWM